MSTLVLSRAAKAPRTTLVLLSLESALESAEALLVTLLVTVVLVFLVLMLVMLVVLAFADYLGTYESNID
ncbi:hypothetical protein N7447_006338 [Penicillium robsamsonii]|uniref:uncharacterized protein n=1 Tax=Penicillium robsamsonii TaxID=1792511 RepID=UPI0025488391|nr:uncharacterized protein N7447_006338 [Penicillium robsamsonii]KAJ5823998.1 hypothetical protein N7447_006338 [Penicillium robsamsonii]